MAPFPIKVPSQRPVRDIGHRQTDGIAAENIFLEKKKRTARMAAAKYRAVAFHAEPGRHSGGACAAPTGEQAGTPPPPSLRANPAAQLT